MSTRLWNSLYQWLEIVQFRLPPPPLVCYASAAVSHYATSVSPASSHYRR